MTRNAQLVCQHLENISREALEKHQDVIRQYVRNRHGVYALFREAKLYYVGLASNLRTRLGHHLKDRHADSWDRFSVYLTISDTHIRELESLLLRIVKPPGNKQRGKFGKSEDLRRSFRQSMRSEWQRKMRDMLGTATPFVRPKRIVSPQVIGRKPVLADYAGKKLTLRARHKGKTVWAFVRKTGLIFFAGKHFSSPSLAGAQAVGRKTCNGWTFWQYQRAPGEWVLLDTLRK